MKNPGPVRRSAGLAALLSFILPGLGQAWAGALRRGVLLALPVLALVALVGAAILANPDAIVLAGVAVQPEVLVGVLVLDGLLLAYRAVVLVDAYRLTRRLADRPGTRAEDGASAVVGGPTRRSRGLAGTAAAGLVGVLLAATLGLHGAVAWADLVAYDRVTGFFTPGGGVEPLPGVHDLPPLDDETAPPDGTSAPTAPPSVRPSGTTDEGPDVMPTPAPTPTPAPLPRWARDGRLNILLIGGDAGAGRWSLRTDTLILLSVDVATHRAALFGIPRNLTNVPLPKESAGAFACHCFPGMINALYVYAMGHPDQFPGGASRGYRAVAGAVQQLTGVTLDGIAVVTLVGFVRLVDALGGLTIHVPEALYDANYPLEDGSGYVVISISAGRHHFDGRTALAYARSRHQDSDYGRMARQQAVLVALRSQLKPCRLVSRLPALLDAAEGASWTNIPVGELPGLLAFAEHVNASKIIKRAFTPPRYSEALTAKQIKQIRAEVRDVFGQPDDASPAPIVVDEGC